jgi:hypothetical protein
MPGQSDRARATTASEAVEAIKMAITDPDRIRRLAARLAD